MDRDIVVDTNVIRLYGTALDPAFRQFFTWLFRRGVLAYSQKLLGEYGRLRSNEVAALINHLMTGRRLQKYDRQVIENINDRHFRYRSNHADRWHVRLVMCTNRRLCLSQDQRLVSDVNRFPRFKSKAAVHPNQLKYQ